jgi:GTP-binding protein HflX
MIEVDKVLTEIGANETPQLVVVNKIDQVPALMERGPVVRYDRSGKVAAIYISAKEGIGLDLMRQTLADFARNTDRMKAPVDEVPSVAELSSQAPVKRWESLDVFHTRTGMYSPFDA